MTQMNKENAYKLFHKTSGIYITSPFGYRDIVKDSKGNIISKSGLHEGVDYGTNGLKIPVYPIVDGKVLSAGQDITGAKFVYVYFESLGMVGLYYHLSEISVRRNQLVNTNTKLGLTGKTGNATGIHLHFDFFPYKDYSKPIMKRDNIDYNTYKFPIEKPKPDSTPTPTPIKKEIKLGDTVIVNGRGYATSYGEGSYTRVYKNQKMKVIAISKGRPYPYALNQYNKGNPGEWYNVTAWFKENDLKIM